MEFQLLLLQLPSRFSRVQLCATPWMAVHQAPPSSQDEALSRYSASLLKPKPSHVISYFYCVTLRDDLGFRSLTFTHKVMN